MLSPSGPGRRSSRGGTRRSCCGSCAGRGRSASGCWHIAHAVAASRAACTAGSSRRDQDGDDGDDDQQFDEREPSAAHRGGSVPMKSMSARTANGRARRSGGIRSVRGYPRNRASAVRPLTKAKERVRFVSDQTRPGASGGSSRREVKAGVEGRVERAVGNGANVKANRGTERVESSQVSPDSRRRPGRGSRPVRTARCDARAGRPGYRRGRGRMSPSPSSGHVRP